MGFLVGTLASSFGYLFDIFWCRGNTHHKCKDGFVFVEWWWDIDVGIKVI